jgi:hypothetical protein
MEDLVMEHQLWSLIVEYVQGCVQRKRSCYTYGDDRIVLVFFWAVLHDRPLSWACLRQNWPIHARRHRLPSPSTLSRRLRAAGVMALLQQVEEAVLRPRGWPPLVWMVDGKPLPIGGCSKDRQAGYGRAAGGMAKGYKLHALIGKDGSVLSWRLTPMQTDERVMARRMLRTAEAQGYVLGDANYDDNALHDICVSKGNLQLVTPRRYGDQRGLGHHRHSPGRLRAIALRNNPLSPFGSDLMAQRQDIERYYGNLTSFAGGLTHLPPWVRGHRRVRRWVQAKLIINQLRIQLRSTSYVA